MGGEGREKGEGFINIHYKLFQEVDTVECTDSLSLPCTYMYVPGSHSGFRCE